MDALIILTQDTSAIKPTIDAAADEGIPVVGYERLIEDPRAFYLTFDNVEVGRMQARTVLAGQPSGNYVMIKGSPSWTSPGGTTMTAVFLVPVPLTADNLTAVTDAG